MKRTIISILLTLTLIITMPFFFMSDVYAEGEAFEVTDYDLTVTVNKDHSYKAEAVVTVNIPGDLDRIELSVPSGNFRMSGLEVVDTAYSSKISTDASSVTITDSEKLTKGSHTFTIRYDIREFADRDESKDVFYFTVLQPSWNQPIAHLNAEFNFPEDFPCKNIMCYSGMLGVQDAESRITFKTSGSKHTVSIEGSMIPENYGVTLQTELDNGYWVNALDGVWAVLAMILVMGSVALILFIMWIIGGRDPKIKRVPVTRPVEGVSPVEVGYVFNSKLDIRDLVRLIIYFAMKGCLRISEYEHKKYNLIRLKDPEGEEKLIRNAYNILFEDVYKGRGLEMENIGDRLVRVEAAIRDDVAAGFADKEMLAYTPISRRFRVTGVILTAAGAAVTNALKYSYQYLSVNYVESAIIGIITGVLIMLICYADDRRYSSNDTSISTAEILFACLLTADAVFIAVGIVRQTGQIIVALAVAALICLSAFLAVIMRARGKGNSVLVMKFRQLRRFIYHPTPKELLENYLEDNNYYYDMLLYALTFGAEESWAISFLTLDVPEPEWYSDDIEGQAFSNLREHPTTIDIARDLRSFARTIETAYNEMTRYRTRG